MEFDWRGAIDRNSEALCTIAARLIVMAGIEAGRTVGTLPRHLYLRILSLLRPAEFAARRLIAMAACKLVPDSGLPLAKEKAASGLLSSGARRRERSSKLKDGTDNLPAFALFDPLKRTGHPWLEPDEIASFDAGYFRCALPPDEPVGAKALGRRIRALAVALSDLEGQALRLARWRARRHLETSKPKRWGPMRPGRPPGYRERPKTAVGDVLKECHLLALDAWNTS